MVSETPRVPDREPYYKDVHVPGRIIAYVAMTLAALICSACAVSVALAEWSGIAACYAS